jgi:serpin B
MKKIAMAVFASACLLTIACFLGCAVDNIEDDGKNAIHIVSVTAKELQAPVYGEDNPAASAAADGANDFAFRLGAALVCQTGDENFVCSPYSVWIPLAALVNATDNEHKAALVTALGAAGLGEAELNNAASRMLYDLTRQRDKKDAEEYGDGGYHDPLKIANAIFVDTNVTLKKDFAQVFMDYYRGSSINVDFRSQDAVTAVNQWAGRNTEGLITNIVQEFDPATVAAIANAIYFSDRWGWEFDPNKTKSDTFHAPSGDTEAFYMLREGNEQVYYEDNRVQAMPLHFKTGGGMYIILPKDGDAAGLLSSMDSGYFDEIQENSDRREGTLLLPRFFIESDVMQLKDTLTELGVPLFDESAAPLTGLLEEIPVWISSAVHKAVIKVDEKGTTAAAVTVIEGATSAGPPEPTEPFEMICNKPFVFILYGNTYDGGNQVLFTGVVNQP